METIKSSSDISFLFAHGQRIKTPYMTLIIGESDVAQHGPNGRVAFIAGKKLGNAVWRNKAKRRLRAVCRECSGPWPGYDVIFLAKSALTDASYSKVLKACNKALERMNFKRKKA